MKPQIPILQHLLCALTILALFTCSLPVYASEAPEPDDPGASITITDITEQQPQTAEINLPSILPISIESKTEDGVKLIVKAFEVAPEVSLLELVEETLSRNGATYAVRDILKKTLPTSQERKTVSQTVTVSADSDQQADILPLLAPGMDYSENGFTGQLALDAGSINTKVEGTEGYTYAVNDTREYTGLARNDPALISKTVQKNGMTLTLCNVKWSGGSENDPAPVYSAVATYTGKASGSKASGYLATATYSGEVVKEIPGNVQYSIMYAAIPVPIIPKGFDWTPVLFILGGLIVAVGIVYIVVIVVAKIKRRRADRVQDEEYIPEAKPLRRKPHALGYLKREESDDVE